LRTWRNRIISEVCADPQTDDERAWRRAAQATLALMAHAQAGDRDPAIARIELSS
jgi:hypothetical protein